MYMTDLKWINHCSHVYTIENIPTKFSSDSKAKKKKKKKKLARQ